MAFTLTEDGWLEDEPRMESVDPATLGGGEGTVKELTIGGWVVDPVPANPFPPS
jgi:hypothetical protein